MANWFYWRDKTLYLNIYLQPGASKNRVAGLHHDCLKICLTTPPVEGRANAHLIEFVAGLFDVPRYQVTLAQGELGRKKRVKIDNPINIELLKKY